MDHYDRHNILSDKQHGFRSKRSCETQLSVTIDSIARTLADGGQVDIILLDFSKAFHTSSPEASLQTTVLRSAWTNPTMDQGLPQQ